MLLDRYLPRIEFNSYEDFKENYKVNIPENFNFGFDIVDEWAKKEPEKNALVWCNDHGEEKKFTFNDISKLSNRTANYFKSIGIKKRNGSNADTKKKMGILDLCNGIAQNRSNFNSRNIAAY